MMIWVILMIDFVSVPLQLLIRIFSSFVFFKFPEREAFFIYQK